MIKLNIISRLVLAVAVAVSAGCARLPANYEKDTTFALTSYSDTPLGNYWQKQFEEHPDESAFYPLGDGLDAFAARVLLAKNAQKSIDAQYYLLHADNAGALFIDQLLKAADRGVRVRLLVDDMDMDGRDFNLAVLDNHPNLQIRVFNPFGRNVGRTVQFVTGLGKQTRRAHNKSFTVDNIATILGGRNIGNEYFRADPHLDFLDLDVLAVGPVAQKVSGSFDQFWNHQLSYPISILVKDSPTKDQTELVYSKFNEYIASLKDSPFLKNIERAELVQAIIGENIEFVWSKGDIVADNPNKFQTSTENTKYHLSNELAPHFENIKEELLILSPYFIPGKDGVEFFRELRSRGVTVKILTNSLSSTDVPIVHSGYAKYRRSLIKMGVELYELNRNLDKKQQDEIKKGAFYESKASLHAKAMVFDGSTIFIGSLNLDPRSVIQNSEIGVIFESPEFGEGIGGIFTNEIQNVAFKLELIKGKDGYVRMAWKGNVDGKPTTLYHEPYTTFWQRFVVNLMRIIPAESQL